MPRPTLSERMSIDATGQLLRTTPSGLRCRIGGVWRHRGNLLFSLRFF